MRKKSTIFVAMVVAVVAFPQFVFTGCKKSSETKLSAPTRETGMMRIDSTECIGPVNIDGRLSFCDEASFTAFMQNLDSTLEENGGDLSGFQATYNINSWRTQFLASLSEETKDTISELPIDSKALGTVMNIDGVLQVGKWIFKLNPDTKMVYVLDEQYTDEIPLLNAPTPASPHVRVFDFETDIFEMLEIAQGARMAKMTGESCSNNEHNKDKNQNFCGSQDYKFKLRYFGYGIWRELITKYKTNVRSEIRIYDFGYDVYWKQKNSSSAHRGHTVSFNGLMLADYFTKDDTKITFYSNTRCLSSYDMKVNVVYYNECQTSSTIYPLYRQYYSQTETLQIN